MTITAIAAIVACLARVFGYLAAKSVKIISIAVKTGDLGPESSSEDTEPLIITAIAAILASEDGASEDGDRLLPKLCSRGATIDLAPYDRERDRDAHRSYFPWTVPQIIELNAGQRSRVRFEIR